MAHNPAIRAYCQQAGKTMELPKIQKRRLLDGLERELEEQFSNETELTLETLCKTAGPPEESAVALMECVDEKERARYHSRQRLLTRLAIIGLFAFVILLIIYCFIAVQHSIDHTEIRIIQYTTE